MLLTHLISIFLNKFENYLQSLFIQSFEVLRKFIVDISKTSALISLGKLSKRQTNNGMK